MRDRFKGLAELAGDIGFSVISFLYLMGFLTMFIIRGIVGVPLIAIPVLLLGQDAAAPAVAERLGRLEVRVQVLERQYIKDELLHRADVAVFTKEQRGLRDIVVAGQAQTKIVWGVFAGILLFLAAASAWKTAWGRIRQWNGHLTQK